MAFFSQEFLAEQLNRIPDAINVDDYLAIDSSLRTAAELSDADIVQSVQHSIPTDAVIESDDDQGDPVPLVSHREAIKAAQLLSAYFLQKACNDGREMAENLEKRIKTVQTASARQSNLRDFFSSQ